MSRTRYRWDEEAKELVEISADWQPTPRVELMTGAFYDGTQATDGTPIDTRKRHREYLKATDSAMASDFTDTIARAKAEREAIRNGTHRTREARQATEAAWVEVERGGRR